MSLAVTPSKLLFALGGNLGTRDAIVTRFAHVVAAMRRWGSVRVSDIYDTAAIGPAQPNYLNAALLVNVRVALPAPSQLLFWTQLVEASHGRTRTAEQWSARTLDIDWLWCDSLNGDWPGPPPLTLPHPRLMDRAFVLRPCLDIMGPAWQPTPNQPTIGTQLQTPLIAAQRVTRTDLTIPTSTERV